MRFLILFPLLLLGSMLFAQATLEELSTQWHTAVDELDDAILDASDTQQRINDLDQSMTWLKKNWEGKLDHGSKKEIKKSKSLYRKALKQKNKLKKEVNRQTKKIATLTAVVASKKSQMNELAHENQKNVHPSMAAPNQFPDFFDFFQLKPSDDLLRYPPSFVCDRVFDADDVILEKRRIDLKHEILFRYQPKFLPRTEVGEAYITCLSSFSLVEGGHYFLNLAFRIYTNDSKGSFGYLDRGSRVVFKFLDGDELTLQNNLLDMGTENHSKGYVTYKTQLPMNIFAQDNIKKNRLDKIIVEWSKGYEQYDVYRVDLLKEQFNCL